MPPLPCTSTRSPGLIAHSTTSARHDVSAAHGSVAASAKLRCSGIAVSADGATRLYCVAQPSVLSPVISRSEEHTSELQSLMRLSYAVFCLKKKKLAHQTDSLRTN